MSAVLANLAVGTGILLGGVALLLMLVGLMAYGRLKHPRLLWVSLAFLLMAVQGAWAAWTAYEARGDPVFPTQAALGLAVVVALYLAVLKR